MLTNPVNLDCGDPEPASYLGGCEVILPCCPGCLSYGGKEGRSVSTLYQYRKVMHYELEKQQAGNEVVRWAGDSPDGCRGVQQFAAGECNHSLPTSPHPRFELSMPGQCLQCRSHSVQLHCGLDGQRVPQDLRIPARPGNLHLHYSVVPIAQGKHL
jgi:hypothetical protein